MRHAGRALLAGFLFLAVGWQAVAAETARVQTVIDGDSVRLVDGRELRLIGINAPEFGRDGNPDQPLARAARERLAALLAGRRVHLDYGAERFDRYGRTLAYLELADGTDVQALLLREGLGWFVAVAPNVARVAAYQRAEGIARRAARGVWALDVYAPMAAERLTRDHTGFRRIAGTVRAVTRRGNDLRVRLADDVYLLVPRDIAPLALAGRRVLARGWLSAYRNRLTMRITHPTMLELQP